MTLLLLTFLIATPPDSDFQPLHEEPDVQVRSAKELGATWPWVRGTTTLPFALVRVKSVVTDYPRYEEKFKAIYKKATVLETNEDGARLHLVWPFPIFMSDRDAVVTYRFEEQPGRFKLQWKNEARPGDPSKGIRIERVEGTLEAESLGPESTKLIYTYYGDLGGDFGVKNNTAAWKKESGIYFKTLAHAITTQQ